MHPFLQLLMAQRHIRGGRGGGLVVVGLSNACRQLMQRLLGQRGRVCGPRCGCPSSANLPTVAMLHNTACRQQHRHPPVLRAALSLVAVVLGSTAGVCKIA